MTMAIIKESFCHFVFITRQFDQAVGGGARNVQLALAHGRLPRLACEHTPDDLQSCRAIRMVFHPLCPSLSCRSHPSGPHCTTCSFSSLDASMIKKGPLPGGNRPKRLRLILLVQTAKQLAPCKCSFGSTD